MRDLQNGDAVEAIDPEADPFPLSRTSTNDATFTQHSLAGSYRRPSYVANGPRLFVGLASQPTDRIPASDQDRSQAIDEERDLLQDNHILTSDVQRRNSHTSNHSSRSLKQRLSVARLSSPRDQKAPIDEEAALPTESTALLPSSNDPPLNPEEVAKTWEDAVVSGAIKTTWQRESRTLAGYAWPLVFTYILQNTLTLTSIFTVGHIGKNELGAVSLGAMTANITGYAIYHGLSTALDTLCAQAYGSGRKTMVGLYLQRMVLFLWAITVPIAVVWFFGEAILRKIVPEDEIAVLAGQYLKVLILGAPGYAAFESAKRYVQAQGRFSVTLYVLMIAAPLNVFLHWLFVWVGLQTLAVFVVISID